MHIVANVYIRYTQYTTLYNICQYFFEKNFFICGNSALCNYLFVGNGEKSAKSDICIDKNIPNCYN